MGEKIYTVRYNVEGIHEQVMATKSLIYALNAIRLSIKDIEMVMRGPTIQNVMWTAIQLTRTYTHLRRIMRMVSREQDAILAKSLAIRAANIGTPMAQTRFGPGGLLVTPTQGMIQRGWSTMTGFVGAHPYAAAAAIGIAAGIGLYGIYYWQTVQAKKAWRERQRETAIRQGIES